MTSVLKVPIAYSGKEKMMNRLLSDPEIDRQHAVLLPRLGFELIGMQYDGERKLNTITKKVAKDATNPSRMAYIYNPVPWNFYFNLNVYAKNSEDLTKIVEQIIPYFTPDFTVTVNLIPEMGIVQDIPVVIQDISIQDQFEGSYKDRRVLIWTIPFALRGYLYGPVKRKPIIKFVDGKMSVPDFGVALADAFDSNQYYPFQQVSVQPALLANGSPTTDRTESIDVLEIDVDDDFGYSVEVQSLPEVE